MLRVGLTGNIACGKSHATGIFSELGAHVIDADVLVHEILARGTPTFDKIVEHFGPTILDADGSINRKALGAIVFGDEGKRSTLNDLVHPEVRKEIGRRIASLEKEREDGIVIIEAALMVETGSYTQYDRLVVVTCDSALQLRRLMVRDRLAASEAGARIAAQMPAEEKTRLAHYVIETSGSFRETRAQIEAVYRSLLADEASLRAQALR
jgi:dephospho-CoA kinase